MFLEYRPHEEFRCPGPAGGGGGGPHGAAGAAAGSVAAAAGGTEVGLLFYLSYTITFWTA